MRNDAGGSSAVGGNEWQRFIEKRVIHVAVKIDEFVDSGWTYKTDRREVVLMAVSKSWAMVRRPRAVPYVCQLKELEFPSA